MAGSAIECLNASWFRTLNDVRSTLALWRDDYNCERPAQQPGLPHPTGVPASVKLCDHLGAKP